MKKEFVNGAKLPSSVEELIFFGTMFRPMWTIHNFFTILTNRVYFNRSWILSYLLSDLFSVATWLNLCLPDGDCLCEELYRQFVFEHFRDAERNPLLYFKFSTFLLREWKR
jgi:hypothetical protein